MTQPPAEAQYGQPPAEFGAPGTAQAHQQPPTPERRVRGVSGLRFGFVGALVALVGAVLVVLAFTTLSWLKQDDSTFAKIDHRLAGSHIAVSGYAQAYFSWLGWVLLGVVLRRGRRGQPARSAEPRSCARSASCSALVGDRADVLGDQVHHLDSTRPISTTCACNALGFYFTVGGFLVIGIGALFGAKRR